MLLSIYTYWSFFSYLILHFNTISSSKIFNSRYDSRIDNNDKTYYETFGTFFFQKKKITVKKHTDLLQPGFLAKNFLTSTCKPASSPWTEPIFQELAKFEAGKQSSATLSQHMRLVSKRNACLVARTTRGKPDFDNFADMTLIVPANRKLDTPIWTAFKIQPTTVW